MTFPGLDDGQKNLFESQRAGSTQGMTAQAVEEIMTLDSDALSSRSQALKQALVQIDLKEAQAGLKNSVAGRLGVTLEGIT